MKHSLIRIILLATLLAALLPLPTDAAGPTGKIALMTSPGGEILLIDPRAGKTQRLTDGMDPVFSPDGTKLAFTRWGVEPGLYVRDMKTGEERRVVGADKPRHPTWSADGARIAFTRLLRVDNCRESILGCLPEDQLRAIFRGQDCGMTPAGQLCISSMPVFKIDRTGITTIGADGQGWLDLAAPLDAQSPAWKPGSDEILIRGNNRLQVTGRDRAPWELVAQNGFNSPAWSPDGTRFVAQQRIHDHTDLALFDASGRLIKYLTKPASAVRRSPNNVSPAWSPDGKTILFLSDRDGGPDTWALYRMNADGSGQAPFLPKALKNAPISYEFAAERMVSWGR